MKNQQNMESILSQMCARLELNWLRNSVVISTDVHTHPPQTNHSIFKI